MKTVLVTGGAGFIGSHLCDYLLNNSCRVLCLDNFYTGSKNNVKHLLDNDKFKLIEHNILEPISINEPIDEIYNLACPASPVWYQKDPLFTLKTNIVGAINVLSLALEKKSKILQASTSEVYGDPLEHPQAESYKGNVNTLGLRACYDEGKRCAETLFMDYHRQFGLSVKIIRIFNTYGPRMAKNDGRVISNFINQALAGEDITVYGDGHQTRSFMYVSDLIAGMIAMMNKDGFIGPVNLGNPEEYTIQEIADKIIVQINSSSKIVYNNLPADDPSRRKPDISLASQELGWRPIINLDNGLEKTIGYFKKIIK